MEDVLGENQVQGLKLKKPNETSEMKIDGFFVAIGHKPNTDLFKGLLEMDEVGMLRTKPHSQRLTLRESLLRRRCGQLLSSSHQRSWNW